MLRVVLLAGATLAVHAGSIALGPYQDVALTWSVSGGVFSATLTCSPQNVTAPPPLAWCAMGVNVPGKGTGMGPAEVFWLSVDNTTGTANAVE